MDNPITRAEHNEFVKRMEDEHHRINKRVNELERVVKQINDLTISINTMATNMKSMLEELKNQGNKIEELEARDGEMWRKAVSHVIMLVVGGVVTYLLTNLGL